jgi:uncharacterized protein (TIGR02444 family)
VSRILGLTEESKTQRLALLNIDNPFWRFSLALYGSEGVREECLALQDTLQIDVNVLLFVAWLGAKRGVNLTAADFALIETEAGSWSTSVIQPLRGVRRFLKPFRDRGGEPIARFARLSAQIELDAEQIEQAMLFDLAESRWESPCRGGAIEAGRVNVEAFIEGCRAIAADHRKQAAPLSNFFRALATLANAAENSRHCGP